MLCSMACLWSQCPGWWPVLRLSFVVGWRVWTQPAAILHQTGIWGSPCTGLVDWAEWSTFMGTGGGSWSWILVCGCRRSSGHQLHLDRVVVTDCQGLEEGKRWEMFGEPLTPRHAAGAGRAVNCPARTFCLLEGAHSPQPQDTRHARLQFWHLSWRGAQAWLGVGPGRGPPAL